MNHTFYNPTPYSPPAVYPNQGEFPNPPQPQPGFPPQGSPYPAEGYPPPLPPQPGYFPPVSGQAGRAWEPSQPGPGNFPSGPAPVYPAQSAPSFSLSRKDPRKTGGVRRLNLAAVIVLIQSGLSFVLPVAIMLMLAAAGLSLQSDGLGQLWLSAAISPVCTALPCLVYMWAGRHDWNDFLRFEHPGFFTGLLCVLGGLGVCLAGNYPAHILEELLQSIGLNPYAGTVTMNPDHSFAGFLQQFAIVAVLVPVMEEFAFRGVLFSSLRRYGAGFAVVGSALVFGMAHLTLPSVVFAFIAGLAMGYVYAKTRNLWLTVMIHALNNGISVILDNADLFVGKAMEDVFMNCLTIVPLILGAISLLLLIILCRKKLFGKNQAPDGEQALQPLNIGESIVCYMKSAALWGLFFVALGCTVLFFLL